MKIGRKVINFISRVFEREFLHSFLIYLEIRGKIRIARVLLIDLLVGITGHLLGSLSGNREK